MSLDASFQVTFVGDHFTLSTTAVLDLDDPALAPFYKAGEDEVLEEKAVEVATEHLISYYGWDMGKVAHDVTVESDLN